MGLNITIPRSELREACQGFSKIVNGKCTLPVLGCVRLESGSRGVTAQVTDLDQTLDYRFDAAQVNGDGACIIPLTTLKDLAKGGKSDSVEFEADDPEHIAIINHVGGHAVCQPVLGMELDEWPAMNTDVPTKRAEGFAETYQRLTAFSSRDETRYVINSVFVEVGKGTNPVTMAATDGRRLACWNSMALPIKKSIIVPITKFLCWNGLGADVDIGVREDKDVIWLGVKAGAFAYTVKTVDGTYPNFRQVVPAEAGAHVITFADSDVELLKQVLPATFPGGEEITLVGHDGKVTLYGRGLDDDRWTTLTLENTTYRGERKFIGLNRHYLLDALAAGFRDLAITDELCPVMSRDSRGGTHVLMPMRVQDPEDKQSSAAPAAAVPNEPETEAQKANPEADEKPEPAPPAVKPRTRRNKVTKQNEEKKDTPALDRVLTTCDAARTKVKEAGQALSELATAIKDAAREQKAQSKEVESARSALAKLQAISL